MEIKVTHVGEDYGLVEINHAEYEISRSLAEVLRATIRQDIKDRTWLCKDETCKGKIVRDYQTLAEVGSPYCPVCDGDMELPSLKNLSVIHDSDVVRNKDGDEIER